MGHRYGKYQLLERIGVGGMAEVFKAKVHGAEGFERLIAIKRILPHLVEDDDFVNMFVDEAKIAVRLNHPNIVAIHDLGKIEDTLFIAMEYVLGRDVRAIYDFENERGQRTPIGVACHIVMKMCEALHHAHFATGPRGEPLKVIHRDVSPQNVLLSFDGEVKVADFGLAKARGRIVQTQAGVVKGKLAYMSPEQLKGGEIDHRVDVFGLGIVLFELLTGERLFLGPSDMDTLRRVYEATVPPMRPINPEINPELEAIVLRALAKDRDQRYPTALALHDDLQAFVYSNGCYAGTTALRRYVHEAFPDAAPPLDDLPPFAVQAPIAAPPPVPQADPPMATRRPPAPRDREVGEILPPPPEEVAPLPMADPLPIDAILLDDDEEDDRPTDRPPPPALGDPMGVVTQPILDTGRPPPAEGSQVQGREFPSTPPGVFEDEAEYDSGPDTNPAPAPEGGLGEFAPWDDPTAFEENGHTEGTEDDWDDATVIVPSKGS